MSDEYAEWEQSVRADQASVLREFMAAMRWTNKVAGAVWGVSAQTVCNWKRSGKYSDAIYRQIYESDWGQMRFNPEWPDRFERCGVGYTWEEEMLLDAKEGGRA